MADEALTGAVFCALGEDGLRAFSRDGKTWTHRQTGKEGEVYATACFGDGRCVVAGRYGGVNIFAATSDGVTWTPSKHEAQYSKYVRCITYYDKQFLAFCGDSGAKPFILPSKDGVQWGEAKLISETKGANGLSALLRRFALGDGLLVGVGDFGRCSASTDGFEWKNAPNAKAVNTLIDVAYGKGVFVGGGMHGLRMRSKDGLDWTDRVLGEEGEHINAMIWDGAQFVGIGQGATYRSPDGLKWERLPNKNAPTAAAFGNGIYVGSLWQGRLMRSTDGIAWEEAAQLPQHVEGLAFGVLGKS